MPRRTSVRNRRSVWRQVRCDRWRAKVWDLQRARQLMSQLFLPSSFVSRYLTRLPRESSRIARLIIPIIYRSRRRSSLVRRTTRINCEVSGGGIKRPITNRHESVNDPSPFALVGKWDYAGPAVALVTPIASLLRKKQ